LANDGAVSAQKVAYAIKKYLKAPEGLTPPAL